jgi:hypothetical protein
LPVKPATQINAIEQPCPRNYWFSAEQLKNRGFATAFSSARLADVGFGLIGLLCNHHEAEVVGFFLNAEDFVLSILFFVVLHPIVDVLFSLAQHPLGAHKNSPCGQIGEVPFGKSCGSSGISACRTPRERRRSKTLTFQMSHCLT